MSRRIALPGADELFRSTGDGNRGEEVPEPQPALLAVAAEPDAPALPAEPYDPDGLDAAAGAVRTATRRRPRALSDRRPTGRERHEEKITVYVSPDELMDLEHARLALRGDHGLPVDRGRVVREALAVVLADFDAKGEASILVRRLRGR
jgi:hypothetical protein